MELLHGALGSSLLATFARVSNAAIACYASTPPVAQAQLIAQSIGQAFQVAYTEFLRANGIKNAGYVQEMDYQDVLNQQEIYGEELELFSNKTLHKDVSGELAVTSSARIRSDGLDGMADSRRFVPASRALHARLLAARRARTPPPPRHQPATPPPTHAGLVTEPHAPYLHP